MPRYEILRGTHRTADGERHTVGDVVELSERQAANFSSEKFRRVDGEEEPAHDQIERVVDPTEEQTSVDDAKEAYVEDHGDEEQLEADLEASMELPDDYDDLQALAMAYDGDEVNGRSSSEEIREFFGDWDPDDLAVIKDAADL